MIVTETVGRSDGAVLLHVGADAGGAYRHYATYVFTVDDATQLRDQLTRTLQHVTPLQPTRERT